MASHCVTIHELLHHEQPEYQSTYASRAAKQRMHHISKCTEHIIALSSIAMYALNCLVTTTPFASNSAASGEASLADFVVNDVLRLPART